MKTYLHKTILLVSLVVAGPLAGQQSSQQWPPQTSATGLPSVSQTQQTPPQDIVGLSSLFTEAGSLSTGRRVQDLTGQTVLVVPAPDLPADGLAAITEDMTVMCRILDKTMAPVLASVGMVNTFDPFTGHAIEGSARAEGLYLDGYGALFFLQVGFPLVAPPQEREQPKAESSADPVWSRTVDELQGSSQNQPRAEAQEYDARQVENLKAVLTKSLRHAANLRVRGPQDLITVVIRTRTRSESGFTYAYGATQPGARAWVAPPASDSSDVLVLRTAKSDVDAFAKGDLTAEQFTDKVQTLRSWTNSGQQVGSETGIMMPSSGSSTIYGR